MRRWGVTWVGDGSIDGGILRCRSLGGEGGCEGSGGRWKITVSNINNNNIFITDCIDHINSIKYIIACYYTNK